jgi:adenine-specific DNA-methyltransferase
MEPLRKLQELLRELFQLEFADLDFGLYRLLHLKRQELEAFLTEQLPRRAEEAFKSMAGQERSILEKEVSELAERIQKDISADALLDSGEPNRGHPGFKAKFGQGLLDAYDAKRQQLQGIQVSEAQQAEVFNHLHAFFSRYYEAGDFIPRRRYGARETYAVPYNGEETFFHWANKDQHYVKTAEAFRDYAFTVEALGGPYRVHFVLTEASVPPGNTKGDTRYFFPLPQEATWDAESRTFRLPFHYRLPTEKEVERFGKNGKLQEALLQDVLEKILRGVPNPTLRAALSATVEQKEDLQVSLLLKRLRHFSRRNTTDYFIHRNLETFLKRELEFYLKDQVLHLGDLEGDLESKRRTIRVIRQLAEEVILFLAQIEEVEKRLFEKRKFVLRTDYLVPIKEVPRKLWPEVLANKAQLEAWKTLFAIEPKKDLFNQKGKVNERFLEEHPTLVVDTRNFDQDFKDRLLAAFDDLDDATDGLLIHSENYQALRLLQRKYAGKVKCIYIDPPYNTGSDDFVYKDRYQHSSWAAMMLERLEKGYELLSDDGVIFVSIDDNEYWRLWPILSTAFRAASYLGSFVWKRRSSSAIGDRPLSLDHEYVLLYAKDPQQSVLYGLVRSIEDYPFEDERGRYASTDLTVGMTKEQRPGQYYPIKNPRTGKTYWPNPQRVWRFFPDTMARVIADGLVIWPDDVGGTMERPRYKTYHHPEKLKAKPVSSWIESPSTNDSELEQEEIEYDLEILTSAMNQEGGRIVEDIFGRKAYAYPKPVSLIRSLVRAGAGRSDSIVDFFAGSGTSGHAVISLNRSDGGSRRFGLVESSLQFDSVLLPRIQKVVFTPEWKDGEPKRLPTKQEVERTPRLVKVLRLEGYEDALHNLGTEDTLKRENPRAAAYKEKLGQDTYRLSYLVRLPLEASASMLNLAALEHPFRYTIEVLTEDGPRIETVDLVETFNLLYGLHVERMETWVNDKDKRSYRAVKGRGQGERRVLVLWRDMEGLDPVVERHFLEVKLKAEGSYDEMLINGDTATPGFSSLDGLFKRLMEEG